MSQTHGDLSGAQPPRDYSACDHSLTHITLGSGNSIQHQYTPSQQPTSHVHYQQHYSRPQQCRPNGAQDSDTGGLQQLPVAGVSSIFESQTALGGPTQLSPSFPALSRPCGAGPSSGNTFGGGGATDSQVSPQDFLCPPQVYDNTMMLKEQGAVVGLGGDPEDNVNDENEERDGQDLDDGGDGNSQGSGKRSRTRRPHLQGRFSGRLTTKEDERRLAEECKLLGPLLGGVGKRGDKSRLTLAKIVRGIATGDVRRFCEERERAIAALKAKLVAIDPEAAASVPVNPIPLPSAGVGSLGGISIGPMAGLGVALSMGADSMGLSAGSLGGPTLGIGMHGPQMEKLQRENSELRGEMYNLRMELQARERLLLELQDTGIISGFVPTSIPLDDPQQLMTHHLGGPGGGGRSQSADLAPSYNMPQRHHSYGAPPMASYGGPSQMSIPHSSAHMSSGLETPGPMGAGGAMGLGSSMGQQPAGGPSMQPGGGGSGGPMGAGGDSAPLASMPAISEHSRASRPLKRPAMLELGCGGGGGGAYNDMLRSMSHAPLGRSGGGGGGGGYPHIDLQQQLNSLQAQVEHLQNLSQAQVGARSAASFLMSARERSSAQIRMGFGGGGGGGGSAGGGGGQQLHYGSGADMSTSPFLSAHAGVAPQGGLLMLHGHPASEGSAHPFQPHPAIGGPLHLQVIKQSGLYDDAGGAGAGGRDMRDPVGMRNGGGGGGAAAARDPDSYAAGSGMDAALEHMINSRAMRGEYDLPLELLLPDSGGKGCGGHVSGTH